MASDDEVYDGEPVDVRPRPLMAESVWREIQSLKSVTQRDSALAVSALYLAETLDSGPEDRDRTPLLRELRLTMLALMGTAARSGSQAPTDEFTQRRQARHDELRRGSARE